MPLWGWRRELAVATVSTAQIANQEKLLLGASNFCFWNYRWTYRQRSHRMRLKRVLFFFACFPLGWNQKPLRMLWQKLIRKISEQRKCDNVFLWVPSSDMDQSWTFKNPCPPAAITPFSYKSHYHSSRKNKKRKSLGLLIYIKICNKAKAVNTMSY